MTRYPLESGERGPNMNMTARIVSGSPAGAIGLLGLPEARPFFLVSGGLAMLLGLILYWKHR